MGITSENSLWYKGKSEVLREFKKGTGQLLSAVASRNFSAMPGFAIEALTDVEIESKLKLTEYNFKIMSDAIDRELKALGLGNDIALKQATMAWELEKIQLFSDLQVEFADKELIRSLSGEAIDGLMIDQEFREIGVLLSKVAIEIEIEDIKRQKEEVELLPLPYEEQLAAAKLAAAQRKLAVIPYILAALAAQSTALTMEEAVIFPARETKANYDKQVADLTTSLVLPLMSQKAAATTTLTAKQVQLLAPLLEKAAASSALAAEMMAQLNNHILLAAEKVEMANEKVLRLTEELSLQGKELTLEGKKIIIERDRAQLELQRANAKVAIAEALRTQLGLIATAMTAESGAEIVYINTQGSNEVAIKSSYITKVEAAKYAAAKSDWASQTAAVIRMAAADKQHSIDMAEDASKAKITETLIHLLK
jgi:hypothetical protein